MNIFVSSFPLLEDGKSEWVGPDSLSDELHKSERAISTVAFGESYSSWMVVYKDGGWAYEDIPRGLSDSIDRMSSSERSDVEACTLGPDGEYFLKTTTNTLWLGGHHLMDEIRDSKLRTRFTSIVFGEGDTYLLRYT